MSVCVSDALYSVCVGMGSFLFVQAVNDAHQPLCVCVCVCVCVRESVCRCVCVCVCV